MVRKNGTKIAIVGTGYVGATTAYTLMLSGLATHISLVDINLGKAEGEALDLQHGMPFCQPALIDFGGYEQCEGADMVIITAGANQKPGETRMDLTEKNLAIFRQMIPEIVRHSGDAVLLVVTNPVDVLTLETIRLAGLPAGRVIGSGTVLDTSRLRYLLSAHANVDPRSVHTYVLGEHGDSEFPAWSLTNIAGQRLDVYCKGCGLCKEGIMTDELRSRFADEVRASAYRIIEKKGATYYAVALAVRRICEAVLRDEKSILTVSSLLTGQCGLNDVCLSLPCIVGAQGVERTLDVELSVDELSALHASAEAVRSHSFAQI